MRQANTLCPASSFRRRSVIEPRTGQIVESSARPWATAARRARRPPPVHQSLRHYPGRRGLAGFPGGGTRAGYGLIAATLLRDQGRRCGAAVRTRGAPLRRAERNGLPHRAGRLRQRGAVVFAVEAFRGRLPQDGARGNGGRGRRGRRSRRRGGHQAGGRRSWGLVLRDVGESGAALEVLRELGVDYAQGYAVSPLQLLRMGGAEGY